MYPKELKASPLLLPRDISIFSAILLSGAGESNGQSRLSEMKYSAVRAKNKDTLIQRTMAKNFDRMYHSIIAVFVLDV